MNGKIVLEPRLLKKLAFTVALCRVSLINDNVKWTANMPSHVNPREPKEKETEKRGLTVAKKINVCLGLGFNKLVCNCSGLTFSFGDSLCDSL